MAKAKKKPEPKPKNEKWILIPVEPTKEMLKGMSSATFLNDGSDLEMHRRFNGLLGSIPLAKATNPWAALLKSFDPKYFNDEDGGRDPQNIDDAAYGVSTWFFDNEKKSALKKMISELPEELWQLALKKWANGKHDT